MDEHKSDSSMTSHDSDCSKGRIMEAEFDYDLWENINEQMDAENVFEFARANICLSHVLYFIRCRIAWRYDRI